MSDINYERITVVDFVPLEVSELRGNINKVIKHLKSVAAEYGPDVNIELDIEEDSLGYHTSITVEATITRKENDAEYQHRIRRHEERRKKQEAVAEKAKTAEEKRELREYKRLQKKYGK